MKMKYPATEPPKIVKFDAQSAVDHMAALFGNQIKKMKKKAEDFVVKDESTIAQASEMATQAKKMIKVVDDKRVEIKAPYLKFTKALDTMARNIKKPLDEIQKLLEGKIGPVALAIEEEKAKAARKAAAEAEKKAKTEVFETPTIQAPSAMQDGKVQAKHGSVSVEKVRKWDLVDFKKVPAAYKVTELNYPKINEAVLNGANIPGLRIYEDSQVKTRLKGGRS